MLTEPIRIRRGRSSSGDAGEAAGEFCATFGQPDLVLAIFFHSIAKAGHDGNRTRLRAVLSQNDAIGFNTNAEHFHGMRIHQMLIAIAIGTDPTETEDG